MTFIHDSNNANVDITNINLEAYGEQYKSYTTHTKSVWYFEYSHRSGGSSYVIGFSSEKGSVGVHPIRLYPSIYAYSTGSVPLNNNDSFTDHQTLTVKLDFQYSYNEHIGIGIDIDNSCVFYVYKNYLNSFKFVTTGKEWSIILRESMSEGFSDIVDAYFEKEDFAYEPPFGALPWYSLKTLSCKHKSNYINIKSLLFNIFNLKR